MSAYLLIRKLSSQYKHPIILNYKRELHNISLYLREIEDPEHRNTRYIQMFRKTMNYALKAGLCRVEGNNLRLLSNTQDRIQFKQSRRNDYRGTINPVKFKNIVLLQHYNHAQDVVSRKKSQPSIEEGKNSDRINQLVRPYNRNVAVNDKFASCRSIMKALGLKSLSQAHKLLNDFHEEGLIELTKRTQKITKGEFRALLERKCHNIRYDKPTNTYFVVLASTFKLKYTLKRTVKTPYQKMTQQERVTALEMGWTKDMINLRG